MKPLQRQNLLIRLLAIAGLAVLLAGIWFVLQALGAPASLSPSDLSAWLQGEGHWGPILLILLMVLAVVVGPIPTLPVSAASGLAFGMLQGTLIAVTGAALGAMVAFWASRILARDYFRRKLSDHPVFASDAPQRSLFWGILFTRLVPLFSFALISYAAGLTSVTALRFLVASVVGMMPMTFVFAGLGHTLEVHPVWTVGAAGMVLLLMALTPWWWRRRGHSGEFR
ncbi:TVP38/TMEM64 family protein [Marinobacter sp.]|uniref:TVP38/TMEM64 family protein n=1 Tax=Marinobacter sp. TaxID=50741 RepID=UPI00356AEB88